MDLKKLTDKAKEVVDKRGGTESVKEDAGELKDIFKGKGSLTDKAKEAAAAIKDPGAAGPGEPAAAAEAGEAGRPQDKHGHGQAGQGAGEHKGPGGGRRQDDGEREQRP